MSPILNDVEKIFYKRIDSFKRFDIVVFKYNSNILIKRIYGLPWENIIINNEKIYINSLELIDDKYCYNFTDEKINNTLGNNYVTISPNQQATITIPENLMTSDLRIEINGS